MLQGQDMVPVLVGTSRQVSATWSLAGTGTAILSLETIYEGK
jgi:hypothetical protein